jgi:hypothetical protein
MPRLEEDFIARVCNIDAADQADLGHFGVTCDVEAELLRDTPSSSVIVMVTGWVYSMQP